jgi:hypothetical protein
MRYKKRLHLDFDVETPVDDIAELGGIPYRNYLACLLLAYEIDVEEAKNLYLRTVTDYEYRKVKGLDTSASIGEEDSINFNTIEMQQAIDFIDNELIPLMENNTKTSFRLFGGRKGVISMIEKMNSTPDFDIYTTEDIYEDEEATALGIYYTLEHLSTVMNESIRLNIPYTSYFG